MTCFSLCLVRLFTSLSSKPFLVFIFVFHGYRRVIFDGKLHINIDIMFLLFDSFVLFVVDISSKN